MFLPALTKFILHQQICTYVHYSYIILMESPDIIYIFLKKMRLDEHYSKFISNSRVEIRSLQDCQIYFKNPNYLKDVGFNATEVNRFKRLFEEAFKASKEEYESQTKRDEIAHTPQTLNSPITNQLIEPQTCASAKGDHIKTIINKTEESFLVIHYKCLSVDNIKAANIKELKIDYSRWMSLRYFELVEIFFQLHRETIPECSSIEMYHRSGRPMATSPSAYFTPVHKIPEDDFKFVFIIPKNLDIIQCRSYSKSCNTHTIEIFHIDTQSRYTLSLHSDYPLLDDLLYLCSKHFHLPSYFISLNFEHPDGKLDNNFSCDQYLNFEHLLERNFKFHFTVSKYFWEPNYLNAFKFDNYFPILEHSTDTLIYLNVYLLFHVRHFQSNQMAASCTVKNCLSLLRNISCSPPLVHSLWLLHSQENITLPHKIAIIEGLITTFKILDESCPKMEALDFPFLWYFLEKHESHYVSQEDVHSQLEEKQNFLSKEIDLPKDRERLCDPAEYRIFRNSNSSISNQPIHLFRAPWITHFNVNYLSMILQNDEVEPCDKHGYSIIESDTPIRESISFHPFVFNTLEKIFSDYSRVLIILDISNDMSSTLGGLRYIPNNISKEYTFFQLDTALLLIEIIVDSLHSRNLQYLLGITLVSNNHGLKDDYSVFYDLTFNYEFVIQELRKWIESHHAKFVEEKSPLHGGIYNALENYSRDKYTNSTEIFIFTNHNFLKRFYGPNIKRLINSILEMSYRVNTIIFGKLGKSSEPFGEIGHLLNIESFSELAVTSDNSKYYYNLFQEYVNHIRGLLKEIATPLHSCFEETYKHIKSNLSNEQTIVDFQQLSSSTQNRVTSSILRHIQKYLSNPNPFVFLYPIDNHVTKWLVIFKFPRKTDFCVSDIVVSLTFSEFYIYQPPTFRVVTPILHPNIHKNGIICHPILLTYYDPYKATLRTIIDSIHSMLLKPIRTHVINRMDGESFLFGNIKKFLSKDRIYMNISSTTPTMSSLPPLPSPPGYLICPLTKKIFREPVISPDGNTYEKSAILEHLKNSKTDPITNKPMTEDCLFPNSAIADCVYMYDLKILY